MDLREDRKLNGRILVLLRELCPNYITYYTLKWLTGGGWKPWVTDHGGWEAWETHFHIANMYGDFAILLIGHNPKVEGGLFVALPDDLCPPNERKGYLPSKTGMPLTAKNLETCIHDYVAIRGSEDSDLPQITWGKRGGSSLVFGIAERRLGRFMMVK